jgi:ABC-type glycerol-3-phosphate transport system substrate-binding protein
MPSLSRRRALQLSGAASALPLVNIHTATSAGRVTCAFWDHWVPAGNDATRKIVAVWAEKNHVEVRLDFLSAIGNKIDLTMGAEAMAKTGHDVFAFDQWTVHQWADELEPVDDVMTSLLAENGPVIEAAEYLAKIKGQWKAVPSGPGSAPLSCCGRISMLRKFAGLDLQAMYPAREVTPPEAPDWTYDTMLKAAEACHKGGFPFGLGCGTTTDSVQTWGTTFGAFGADLVDGKGNITVDSDNVRAALDYAKRMIPFLPPDTVSYDDASNNRALISGKSALIWNPPSAWAVAKRDAPRVAADCWTFPNPLGPKGVRLVPMRPYFWGIWTFARNKPAAKELIHWLMQRPQAEALTTAVDGYDIPPFKSFDDFKIWSQVEPPKGTVYNYPLRPWHQAKYYVPGSAAPPEIAVQMWNRGTVPTMVAKLVSGQTPEQAIAWAKDELEGFI